jgi:hypothetical protein
MPLALATLDVSALFRDRNMFASRRNWEAAGFTLVNRTSNGKITVAQHPAAPGVLFKKYTGNVDEDDQTHNFERRADGSRRLRSLIADRGLVHVTVPEKQIVELPRTFARHGRAHILAVERLDVLDENSTKTAYAQIDPAVLRDLCVVVYHYRGMDSNTKNLPFVVGGKIAFIDTEHWDRGTSKAYLHQVSEYLTSAGRKIAQRFFDQLEDGDDPAMPRMSRRDFDDEDTSASSSSSSSSS